MFQRKRMCDVIRLLLIGTVVLVTGVLLVTTCAQAIVIHNSWCGLTVVVSITAGGLTIDPMTELWIFPDDSLDDIIIDSSKTPSWNTPATSGTWSSAFVYQDPSGTSYPLGGVKFSTSGTGLVGGDSAEFTAYTKLEGGGPDTADFWDVFTYDSSTGKYTFVDNAPCVPEPSSVILFGLGLIGFVALRSRLSYPS